MSDKPLGGTALGAQLLERAKAHFSTEGVHAVEIPEWAAPGGPPAIVWVSPLSYEERDKLLRQCTRNGKLAEHEFAAKMVIAKAKDENGEKLFNVGAVATLTREVDFKVLQRLADAIAGNVPERDAPERDELLEPSPPTVN